MSQASNAPKGRVLIVIRQFFPLAGGAETQALRQALSYASLGYQVRVVTSRHDPALPRRDTVQGLPVVRLTAAHIRFVGSVMFLASLAAYLIRHAREYDAVLAFHVKQAAAISAVVGRLLGKRVVISDQAGSVFGDIVAMRNARLGGLVLFISRAARLFISGSSGITAELLEIGVKPDRIRFIPNGVPAEVFAPRDKVATRAALGIPPDSFVVVNVGRHNAAKDLKTLLSAWREFSHSRPNAILSLVGDGEERAMLEQAAREWNLTQSVRFEGWHSNVADYLAATDVFASCSISEGTHIALAEAMAARLPVVVTPVGGAIDFVKAGENGFTFPVGAASELAGRLADLYADPGLRLSMGQAGRKVAESQLAQDETVRRHLDALFGPLTPPQAQRDRRVGIAFLIATLDRGGSEQQLAELAYHLDRNRFNINVLCLTRGGPSQEILDKAGIPVRVFGKRSKLAIVTLFRLVGELQRSRPSILHTWLFTSNLYGRIACVIARVPHVIISERSTDLWKSHWHRSVDRMLTRVTDLVVANSAAVKASLITNGICGNRVRVIPNGVDTDRFHPRDKREARLALGLAPEGPYMGYIGRLAFEKRPEMFMEAAKKVLAAMPDAKAILFGDGPMRAELESSAKNYGGRIQFYGDCNQAELAHAAVDCLVLTSAWEGFPNVVLEALASARPVVAVRMPATQELIEDGVTGVLVEDRVDAVSEGVMRVLSAPEQWATQGMRARDRVVEIYSIAAMVKSYESLYFEIMGSSGSGKTA